MRTASALESTRASAKCATAARRRAIGPTSRAFRTSTFRSPSSATQATARRARRCTRWSSGDSNRSEPVPKSTPVAPADLDSLAGMYRNIERGDVLNIQRAEGTIRFEGEAPLIAQSSRRFVDGDGTTVEFDGGGGATIDEGTGAPIRLQRVPATQPKAAELAALAGDYVSDEAETTLTVRARDGVLEATQRPDKVYRLTPLYADAFSSDLGTIIFRRDGDGHPNAFSVVEDRVWDLRFQRQDNSQDHAAVVAKLERPRRINRDQAIVRKDPVPRSKPTWPRTFARLTAAGLWRQKTSFVEGIVSDQLEIDPYSVEDFDVRVFGGHLPPEWPYAHDGTLRSEAVREPLSLHRRLRSPERRMESRQRADHQDSRAQMSGQCAG